MRDTQHHRRAEPGREEREIPAEAWRRVVGHDRRRSLHPRGCSVIFRRHPSGHGDDEPDEHRPQGRLESEARTADTFCRRYGVEFHWIR
jgi:hypothetical protein